MKLHRIEPRPLGWTLVGSLLALDPGLSVDPTGLVAARVGQDRAGGLRIAVDLVCEMPPPSPVEAVPALVEEALAEMRRALGAEPLVLVDVSNNAALLSLLGRVLPFKRLVPIVITAGEAHAVTPGILPVIGTDGRTHHSPSGRCRATRCSASSTRWAAPAPSPCRTPRCSPTWPGCASRCRRPASRSRRAAGGGSRCRRAPTTTC